MLYRLLLINVIALSLSACFWDDYEKSNIVSQTVPPANDNETLPDSGVVPNGNLEDSTDMATGWEGYANAGTALFGLSTAQYYTGKQSFKTSITAVGESASDIGVGPVEIPVQQDYVYYFSGWVLGTNGATANFVAHPTGAPETILAEQQVDVRSTWSKVTFQFTAPAGVDSVSLPALLSYDQNLGADIYLDHFALIEQKPTGSVEDIPIADGLAGWSTDQATNTISYDASRGVVIEPDWTEDDQVAMYTLNAPMMTGVTLNFVLDIPQEYLDAGIGVQPYVQEVGGTYQGDWSGFKPADQLTAGLNFIEYTPSAPPEEFQRIGLQVKGEDRTADPLSTISIQRIYYSSEEEGGSDLPLDAGWTSSNDSVVYGSAGVSYSPAAEDDNLYYVLAGPASLEGATVVFTLDLNQASVDSGADLQPFAQQDFGSYTGFWNCFYENDALTVGSAEYSCTIDSDDGLFNTGEGEGVRLGFQVKGSPTGTVTVTDVQVEYPSLPVTQGWRASTAAEPVYDGGVQYSPTEEDQSLLYDVSADNYSGSTDFEGATFHFSIVVSEDFKASGAAVQPFAQVKLGSYPGEWGCYINNTDLSTTGGTYDCLLQAADFNLPPEGMQIGIQVKGENITGWVKITEVTITYAD